MKILRFSLLLLSAAIWLQTAHAQTEPPVEGLRFLSFGASGKASLPPEISGTFSYSFSRTSNAFMILDFTKTWLVEEMVETNLALTIHGTNWWLVNPTNSSLGDIYSRLWVGKDTNGIATEPYEETVYYQNAISPFLGKGNLTNVMGWSRLAGVSAEMELVIAGDPAFTNDVVVKFTITATDKDTGEAIPDADITVGGASVTNGVAWQSYKEHTTNDVTPVITGHANWTADLSAGIYRLTLEGSGFLFLDVDTNSTAPPDPNSFGTNLLASAPATASQANQSGTNTNTVPLILYSHPFQPISVPATNELKTLIGAKMTFTGKLPATDAGAVFTNFQWTIGGTTVSNFFIGTNYVTNTSGTIETQHVGQAVAEYPKTNQSVTFAWWKPGKAVVKFDCKINGKDASAQCEVNVSKPPASIRAVGDGEILSDIGPVTIGRVYTAEDGSTARIKLGLALPTNRGVMFIIREKLNYHQFGWIQVIKSSARTTYRDQKVETIDGQVFTRTNRVVTASGLDGEPLLGFSDPYDDSPKDAFASRVEDGNLGASIDDKFTLSLMFNPGGAGVWVPLESVDWGWKVALTNSTTPWGPNTNWPNKLTVEPVNKLPGFPSWNKKVLSGQ